MTTTEDRRAFLERSLADLEAEHDAGDLSDTDHARLRADYERRLAVLEGRSPTPVRAAPPARSGWRTGAAVAAVLVFAVVAGVLVAQSSGRRDAGDTITGADPNDTGSESTATTLPEALAGCFDLQGGEAFDCYIAYTRANADDPNGFLYFGLYSINQGLESESEELLSGGETFLRRALELDPGHVQARANLAVLLERLGRDDEAAAELAHLDGVDLPPSVQQLVDFVRQNLGASSTTVP